MFCMAIRTNSDYFAIHHQLTGFYNRVGRCLCAVRAEYLNIILVNVGLERLKQDVRALTGFIWRRTGTGGAVVNMLMNLVVP